MPSDLSPPPPTEADLKTLTIRAEHGGSVGDRALARAVLYLLHRDQQADVFRRSVDDYFDDLTHQVEALQGITARNLESAAPNPSSGGAAGGEGEEGSTLDDVLRGACSGGWVCIAPDGTLYEVEVYRTDDHGNRTAHLTPVEAP